MSSGDAPVVSASVLATAGSGAGWILAGVAVVALLESSVGLGVVLPAETVVVSAAAAAAHGLAPLWAVFVVAWVCGAAGDNVGFWIGRRWGRDVIERYGPRVGLTSDRAHHRHSTRKGEPAPSDVQMAGHRRTEG